MTEAERGRAVRIACAAVGQTVAGAACGAGKSGQQVGLVAAALYVVLLLLYAFEFAFFLAQQQLQMLETLLELYFLTYVFAHDHES